MADDAAGASWEEQKAKWGARGARGMRTCAPGRECLADGRTGRQALEEQSGNNEAPEDAFVRGLAEARAEKERRRASGGGAGSRASPHHHRSRAAAPSPRAPRRGPLQRRPRAPRCCRTAPRGPGGPCGRRRGTRGPGRRCACRGRRARPISPFAPPTTRRRRRRPLLRYGSRVAAQLSSAGDDT